MSRPPTSAAQGSETSPQRPVLVKDQRWRMPPVVQASFALHVIAVVTTLIHPAAWPWTLAAILANHAALTVATVWPRSHLLGANLLRLPEAAIQRREIAITFDDGPDPEVTPQVLALLDRYGVQASFFCIGVRVERHPDLAREIVARGHRIENHSQIHRHNFSLLGPGGYRRELMCAQETITKITGIAPVFFRAPAGLRNPFLDPVLHRLGLRLCSWTRRGFDTVERDAERVATRLLKGLAAGDILLLHDGHAALSTSGQPMILEVLPRVLKACRVQSLNVVRLDQAFNPQVIQKTIDV